MNFRIPLFLFLLLGSGIATCQTYSLSLAFGDRAATILPFSHSFDKTFYPCTQFGAQITYFEKKVVDLGQTAILHYSYHPYLGNDLGIFSEFFFKIKIKSSFFSQINLGVGYLCEISNTPTFKPVNGEYKKVVAANSMLLLPLSLHLGYEFHSGIAPFITYQYHIQFPYNKTIFALPTDNLLLGIKYRLQQKNKL